jgi:Tfp pilus assembly ATPase PilU
MVRSILAGVLKGIVSQRLLPRVGGGRVAAVEVMVSNDRTAELIRENKPEGIPAAIADGAYYDMVTLTQALIELVLDGLVEREVASTAAPNRHDFVIALEHAEKRRAAEALNPAVGAHGQAKVEPESAAGADGQSLRLVPVPRVAG